MTYLKFENLYFCGIFFFSGFLMSPCRPAHLQKHSQPYWPGHHSGSSQLWPRPGWSGSVQRARPGDVWPAQTQVLCGGAETTAHDQESPQGLHPRRPEGNLLLVWKLSLTACCCLLKVREEAHGGQKSIDVRSQEESLLLLFSSREKHFGLDEADPEPFVQIVIDLD